MEAAFGILGRTALRIDGRADEGWGPPRERAVLATLLLHAGKPVPIETLIDWVWPEEQAEPRNPISTFHTYATRIRKSLYRAGASVALVAEDGSYRLDVDRSEIDYYQFKSLMANVRALLRHGQTLEASDLALQAIRLWRGRPLDELRTDHARNWRRRVLIDDWLPANTTLIETLLELGEHENALARTDDLLAEHPTSLALAKVRLAALYKLARYTDADVYYFNARRRLVGESDLLAAEHLRQFHDSLMETQPPPTRVDVHPQENILTPRQLPHDPPDFIGREALLDALDDASTSSAGDLQPGVIIVDGMPGVGKTALAVHWAHRARRQFPDGDFYVNLHGYSENAKVALSTVVDEFLIALGHTPNPNLTGRARDLLLSRLLANRRTLVVLDNVRDTAHIEDLIPLLSSSVVVVTSRQRLSKLFAATGARRVRVEPMTVEEATELMSARIRGRDDVSSADRSHMAELCGGLPIVITVLAGHVATWPSAQISEFSERLDHRQLVLEVGDDGDGSASAQSFFAWSYDKLADPERRLFRMLGVHPGPELSMEAASACDGRTLAETKRSLGVLAGAHLLEQGENLGRYRFHDLLHEYAAVCSELDDTPNVRRSGQRRMLSYYLTTATQAHHTLYPGHVTAPELPAEDGVESASFTDTAEARSWFDGERTNVAAAVQYAAANGHHDYAWRLGDMVAIYLDRRGAYRDSRTVRELAVSSAASDGDSEAEASCQVGLGMVLMILGEHSVARQCFDAGLRFAEAQGNDRGQASALHQLARLEMSRGDPRAASELYRRSLDIALRMNDHEALCWTNCRLGQALRITGEHDQALLHLHQSQFHAQRLGDGSVHASGLAEIGLVHSDRGDHRTAIAYCEQALGIIDAMPIPDLAITTQIYVKLAEINLAAGGPKSAAEHAVQAIVLAGRSHDATAEALGREVLGDAHFANGEQLDAVAAWRQAKDLNEITGNTRRAADVQAKIDKSV